MFADYYHILEVEITASAEEIKYAYRKLSKLWHPDRNHQFESTSQMQMINEAYLILGSEHSRRRYDHEYGNFVQWKTSHVTHATTEDTEKEQSNTTTAESGSSYEEYIVEDEILERWMDDAIRKAKAMGKQVAEESSAILVSVGYSAFWYSVAAIIVLILLYLTT